MDDITSITNPSAPILNPAYSGLPGNVFHIEPTHAEVGVTSPTLHYPVHDQVASALGYVGMLAMIAMLVAVLLRR